MFWPCTRLAKRPFPQRVRTGSLGVHLVTTPSPHGSPGLRSPFGTHPDNREQTNKHRFLSINIFLCISNLAVLLLRDLLITYPLAYRFPVDAWPWKSPAKPRNVIGDILPGHLSQHPVCPQSTDEKPRSREGTSPFSLCQSQRADPGLLNQPGSCSITAEGNSHSMENRNVSEVLGGPYFLNGK